MMKTLVLTVSLVLAGCGLSNVREVRQADPSLGLREAIGQVAEADLKAAFDHAVANDDAIAAVCFASLAKHLDSIPKVSSEKPKGAFEAFERARVVRLRLEKGVPDDLRIGCSALFTEERDFWVRMAATLAR